MYHSPSAPDRRRVRGQTTTGARLRVDVCLKHAVQDDFSGIDLPAGPQRFDAAQSFAFVRRRHGLENGDLDRTHRQQAFLVSVTHQLQRTGTFADLGTMN